MELYIGIDPGAKGAVSAVNGRGQYVSSKDMPITPKTTGKGNETNAYLLVSAIKEIIYDYESTAREKLDFLDIHIGIEAVSAMPGQGVTGMFSFGRSLGVIEGVIAGLGYPVTFFRPRAWKKVHGLISKDKDQARTLVIGKWPASAHFFKRVKDQGRADAALIAETLRLQIQG